MSFENRNSNLMALKLKTICCRILFLIQLPRVIVPSTNSSQSSGRTLWWFPSPCNCQRNWSFKLLSPSYTVDYQMFSVVGDYPYSSPKRLPSDGTQWRNSISSFRIQLWQLQSFTYIDPFSCSYLSRSLIEHSFARFEAVKFQAPHIIVRADQYFNNVDLHPFRNGPMHVICIPNCIEEP